MREEPNTPPALSRTARFFQSFLITALVAALLLFYTTLQSSTLSSVVITAFGLAGLALVLLKYLQRDEQPQPSGGLPFPPPNLQLVISALTRDIYALNNRLNTLEAPWTTADREALRDHVKELLTSDIALEDLQAKVQNLASDLSKRTVTDVLEAQLSATLQRLNYAVPQILRRANLNLVIGILTTIVGITFLGVGVLEAVKNVEDPTLFAARFLPRLSLAILIELFAYFFLRLYKADLDGVRYMQNEMTNVEMARSAFITTIMLNEKQTANAIALKLAGTDRNAAFAPAGASPVSTKQITTAIELLRAAAGVKSGQG